MSSADLNWLIVRNNHAFLFKKRNIKKAFSGEPGNLANVNSKRHNGFVNRKAITIEPVPKSKGKGVVMSYKSVRYQNKPCKNSIKTSITAGPRKGLLSVRRFVKHNNYRKDLLMTSLRRASAIYRSQKPVAAQSKRRHKVAKSSKPSKAGKGSKKSE